MPSELLRRWLPNLAADALTRLDLVVPVLRRDLLDERVERQLIICAW